VIEFLDKGWPNKIWRIKECGKLRHYFKIRNNLTKENGLIYFYNRWIVPKIMKKYVMKKLHETHLEINKTLKKAKQLFYRPALTSDIEQYISECKTCLKFSQSKQKQPLLQHVSPFLPFQKLALEIAEFENSIYLIIAYYYSR